MQAEDGRIYLTVMQTGCERIAINWNNYLHADTASAMHILQLDGRFRPDFGWFGFEEPLETSGQIGREGLEVTARDPESGHRIVWKLVLESLPNRDLCARISDNQERSFPPRLAVLRTARDRSEEDAAARRSEKGCTESPGRPPNTR